MNAFLILAGGLAMAGATVCPDDSDAVPEHGTGKACNAAPAQSLVGRERTEVSGAEIKRLTGAGLLRWIPHDGVVTMDYREDRVNVRLDRQNRIVSISCG